MCAVISRLVLVLAFVGFGAPTAAQTPIADGPCDANTEQLPRLNSLSVQTGRLAPGESTCLGLMLQRGEFTRISIGRGYFMTTAKSLGTNGF